MPVMGTAARRLSLRAHFGPDRHADALPILYVALLTGDPFGAGAEPTSTGGYARKAINNDGTLWGTVAVGQTTVTSLIAVEFAVATDLYSTGATPLTHWAVYDNSSGGNLWYGGAFGSGTSIVITGAGDQARIPAGTWLFSQSGT